MGISYHIYKHYFPEAIAAASIRRIPATSGIVLMYHEVLPDEIFLPAWTIVRESNFRWQMSYLKEHFEVINIDDALKRIDGRHVGKRPFVIVTFDDGYRGNYKTVLPIMEAMGLPFTVYIATKAILEKRLYWHDNIINLLNLREDVRLIIYYNDHPEYFSIPWCEENHRWVKVQKLLDRLKQMAPEEREKTVRNITNEFSVTKSQLEMLSEDELRRLAGSTCVSIGCHTHGHELLDQLDSQEIRATLILANEHINRITGICPDHLAYPNGNLNELVLDVANNVGFKTAVTISPGIWSGMSYKLQIPRICIGRFDTNFSFKARVSGYL